jgi:copper homeostasis protein
MLLEVIATTTEDALIASKHGADRIELITGFMEGGLTPSIGLIEQTAHLISTPVQVMVRPHSRSFVYSKSDLDTMIRDIKAIRHYGRRGMGIVIGVLTENHLIHHAALERILDAAEDMDVTFHRAFDEIVNQEDAYVQLSNYSQIKRVLTSGGKPSALQATDRLKRLVEISKHSHVAILAGGGLDSNSLAGFVHDTGVQEIHLGTAVRGPNGPIDLVEASKVRNVRTILDQVK